MINRGKLYFAIISAYLGLLGVSLQKVSGIPELTHIDKALYLGGMACVAVSLLWVIRGIGILKYARPHDHHQIVFRGEHVLLSDEEFREERVLDYSNAIHQDFSSNEKRADKLRRSTYALFTGVVLHLGLIFSIILR